MSRLGRKVGIITGAVRGIGRATAERFCAEGASLVIVDIDGEGVERTAFEIADKGGRVVGQKCDVSDAASCEAAVKRAVDEFGKLNILMNNAAYFIGQNTVEEVTQPWLELHSANIRVCTMVTSSQKAHARVGDICRYLALFWCIAPTS